MGKYERLLNAIQDFVEDPEPRLSAKEYAEKLIKHSKTNEAWDTSLDEFFAMMELAIK